jgi:2-oxoglutarate dehydrogenase E1 component
MPASTVKLALATALTAFTLEARASETLKPAPAAPAVAKPAAAQAPAAAAAKPAPAPATASATPAPAAASAKAPAAAKPAAQPAAEGVSVQNAPVAAAGTGCEDVKAQIDAKLKAKGVKAFTLDIVGKDEVKGAKVVGSCEAGKKKITYKRG